MPLDALIFISPGQSFPFPHQGPDYLVPRIVYLSGSTSLAQLLCKSYKRTTMSGRGDKNKQGTSGRGASHQSTQAFADNRPSKRKPENRKTYNLVIDQVPYEVTTEAFTFNGEQRYYVSVNGSPDHVFTWDSELGRLAAIDRDASTLPDALEEEISNTLQQNLQQ
jgi:hypothetical protein